MGSVVHVVNFARRGYQFRYGTLRNRYGGGNAFSSLLQFKVNGAESRLERGLDAVQPAHLGLDGEDLESFVLWLYAGELFHHRDGSDTCPCVVAGAVEIPVLPQGGTIVFHNGGIAVVHKVLGHFGMSHYAERFEDISV